MYKIDTSRSFSNRSFKVLQKSLKPTYKIKMIFNLIKNGVIWKINKNCIYFIF